VQKGARYYVCSVDIVDTEEERHQHILKTPC
jgi:hypothetical protein